MKRETPPRPADGVESHQTGVDLGGLMSVLSDHLYSTPDVAIRELVQNAHDAIVRRALTDDAAPAGRIDVCTDGDARTLEVRDNGEPIPATRRDQIFAAYQRAHQPIKGTPQSVGLGLTVSSTLADLMGGSLEYDHDGTEAVFRLTLPAA